MDKLPNVVIVEQNERSSSSNKKDSSSRKFIPSGLFSFRTLYLILGAIIVVESVMGIRVLFNKVPQTTKKAQVIQSSEPKIALVSDKNSYKVGENVPVIVNLTTGNHSSNGVDIVLKFDPKLLSIDQKTGFAAGSIFAEYPGLRIDQVKGTLEVSGISSPTGGDFNGTGEFAKIIFKAKAIGTAKLSLDFAKGSTIDTNIIDNKTGEDILTSVDNLDLTIQ